MADPNGTTSPAVAAETSTGDLVKHLSEQVSRLIRDELRLAEYEMTAKAKRQAGARACSAVVVFWRCTVLAVSWRRPLSASPWSCPAWAAALIVGGALLIIAGIAAMMGKSQFGRATPAVPEQTVQSVKADVEEIKERAHR